MTYVQFPQIPRVPSPGFFCCTKVLTSRGKNPNFPQGAHKLCPRSVTINPMEVTHTMNSPMGSALPWDQPSHWISPLTKSAHSGDQPSHRISPLKGQRSHRISPHMGLYLYITCDRPVPNVNTWKFRWGARAF